MLGKIKVIRVPEDTAYICWAGRILPYMKHPNNVLVVINAFSGKIATDTKNGFVVSTARAIDILAMDVNYELASEVRDHFVADAFPYLFFPENCCVKLTSDKLSKPILT